VAAPTARLLAPRLPLPEPPRRPVCPPPHQARPTPRPASPRPVPPQRARLADCASPPVCRFLRCFTPDPSKPAVNRRGFESLSAHSSTTRGRLRRARVVAEWAECVPASPVRARLRRAGLAAPAGRASNSSAPTVKNGAWLCLLATSGTTTLRLGGYERAERSGASRRGRVQ
jgi:hypothetical protein